MSEAITVMIVDDHAVVRHGMRALLEAEGDFTVVGEMASGAEAVLRVGDLVPEVVLMDLLMPDLDGVEATRLIKQRSPNSQVIILTSYHEDEHIFPAIRAGALSYLLNGASLEELTAAVRKAARGEATLHPHVAARLVQPINHFEIFVEVDALDRWHPGLENLEPADRPVVTALPRRLQPRGPGRADAADEVKRSVARGRYIDGDLAVTDFHFSYHRSSSPN